MKRCLPLILVLVLLLSACTASETPPDDPAVDPDPVPVAQGYALPAENRDAGTMFFDDDGWYTCVAGAVNYYDYASGQTMVLCAQPGCSHGDDSCQAWLSSANSLAVFDGQLYATLCDDSIGAQLVRKELSTGKITVLERWDNTDSCSYSASLGRFSCGKASVFLTSRIYEWKEDVYYESRTEEQYFLYDLSSETCRELPVTGRVMGFSDHWAAVVETLEDEAELSEEEFHAQYGEDASYGRYLYQNTRRQLLLWNLEDDSSTLVADHDRDGYLMTVDPQQVYGLEHIYQCGDELRLLDLASGESRTLLRMENIINYWVMDHKAFFITQENYLQAGTEPSHLWVADLSDGQPVELTGAMDEQGSMSLSISQEGGSFFRAYSPDGWCVISKEDFYAGRYENAVPSV